MELAKISILTILAWAILFNFVSGKTKKMPRNRKRLKDRKIWKYVKDSINVTEFTDESTQNYLETNIYPSLELTTINTSQNITNNYEEQYINTTPQCQTNIIPSTDLTVFLKSTNATETTNVEGNLTNANPYIEDYLQFNDELDNLTNNLQQVSKDWYYNVRFHCSNSWRSIQEVLEENRKALIDWEIALFDIINNIYSNDEAYNEIEHEPTESFEQILVTPEVTLHNMTVPPELSVKYLRIHAAKNKKMKPFQNKAVKQEFDEENDEEPKITSKCVSAINLAEALRVYWKEEILECLQTYLKEIKHEEVSARDFEDKINLITHSSLKSLANITGECNQLHGNNKSECATTAWHKVRSKLQGLHQELERHYLNHEVQNLQITMGIEMCRQVGKIYDKTMDQQLQAIQRCSLYSI